MFYFQAVCGLSPTRSALLSAPMAISTGVLAPFVGKIVDRAHPRPIIGFGFSALAVALTWLSVEMTATTPIWRLVLPLAVMGVGMAFIWAPLAATATRSLPPDLAGAGSGVYNAVRQVGSVLGSASVAAFMTWRLSADMPLMPDGAPAASEGAVTQLPVFLHAPFASAMSQSMLLPAFVALFGVVGALFLLGPRQSGAPGLDDEEQITERIAAEDYEPDLFHFDDDDYAEYTVSAGDLHAEDVTEPMAAAAAAVSDLHDARPQPSELGGPIGLVHNGFHVDHQERFRDLHDLARREQQPYPRSAGLDNDAESYGRHAMPSRD
jgi:hypothetical protein